jgi:hypothetical protein
MAMVWPWGLLSKANPLALRKLSRLKLKLMPWWTMPKLSWRPRNLRCEGVELCLLAQVL